MKAAAGSPLFAQSPTVAAARGSAILALRPLTAARFHLARRGAVRVAVWQERPQCRFFGRYTFAGLPGTNALHLPRHIGRHPVVVGLYRLVGVAAERTVLDLRVRVVRTHGRLRVRHSSFGDICIPAADSTIFTAAGSGLPILPTSTSTSSAAGPVHHVRAAHGSRTAAQPPAAATHPQPKLAARVEQAVRHTLLFVLLALAIVLLAGGALPGTAVADGPVAAVARHRPALTSAGLALVAAAALAAFLH